MNAFETLWAQLQMLANQLVRDMGVWVDRLDPSARLFILIFFTLILLFIVVRRDNRGAHKGKPIFQFIFAMAIVVTISFGAAWYFLPKA